MLQIEIAFKFGFQLDQPLLHRPQGGVAIPHDVANHTKDAGNDRHHERLELFKTFPNGIEALVDGFKTLVHFLFQRLLTRL